MSNTIHDGKLLDLRVSQNAASEPRGTAGKCDRCNAVYLPSPTTGLQMLDKCPQCFGPLVAVQEQEQRP